jgi:TPR repeat protein
MTIPSRNAFAPKRVPYAQRTPAGWLLVLCLGAAAPLFAQRGGRYDANVAARNLNPMNWGYNHPSTSGVLSGPLHGYSSTTPGAYEYDKGWDFYFGRGLSAVDYEKARKHFCRGAAYGFSPAQRACGIMLSLGQGGPRDDVASAGWLKKAAEQGDVDAQLLYGDLCHSGKSVEKSDAEAAAWWRKAAETGKPEAQNNLALLYLRGDGVPRDDAAGLTWLSKAALSGYAPSQLYLGRIFMQGEDKKSAYFWLRKAAAQKDPAALKLLEELAPQLTPEIRDAVERELQPAAAGSAPKPEN